MDGMKTDGTQLYCTFELDGYQFGIGVERVHEVLRSQPTTRVPLAHSLIRGLINLRGEIVTAVDLRKRFGMPPRDDGQIAMNVVVRSSTGEALALLVDEIGDVVEVERHRVEPPPATLRGTTRELVDHVCKLDEGILMVLDLDRTLGFEQSTGEAA